MAAREGLIRAISLLVQDGVQLMEWGDQVMKSFGYPAVPIVRSIAAVTTIANG